MAYCIKIVVVIVKLLYLGIWKSTNKLYPRNFKERKDSSLLKMCYLRPICLRTYLAVMSYVCAQVCVYISFYPHSQNLERRRRWRITDYIFAKISLYMWPIQIVKGDSANNQRNYSREVSTNN